MIRLLFSSAGRRVELVNCFREAAKELKIDIQVIGIDLNPYWSPACQIADHAYSVSRCTNPNYIDEIIRICEHHKIDLIIPTIDTELMVYANSLRQFAERGTKVLVSAPDVIAVARDKGKTAKVLQENGILVPKTLQIPNALKFDNNIRFPLLVKPKDGSCSAGIIWVDSVDALVRANIDSNAYIAQEACQGQEYTINAYYKPNGRCAACVPHLRRLVRAGEVCFAETVRIQEFTEIAHKFSNIFKGIRGNICFQGFKEPDGRVRVFEINARFGGGYPICDRAGGTYAKWILQELSEMTPDYNDDWREGVRMLRYDAAVFTRSE